MATISEVYEMFHDAANKAYEIAAQIIIEDEQILVDTNISQLQFGFDSEGRRITPEYSYEYLKVKKLGSAPFGTPDLHVTGLFYSEIELDKEKFILKNDKTAYSKFLVARYGDDIFGLTKENLKGYSEMEFLKKFKDRFEKELK